MLNIENIFYKYGERAVISDMSFRAGDGEFIGIIGPNGAGKSTLIKLINGLMPLDGGQILLDDRAISDYPRKELARNMAYVPQENDFVFPYTVREIVQMGRYPHLGGWQFLSGLHDEVVDNAMNVLEISSFSSRKINELSGGEKQRVVIASAFAQQPRILLLDEPTSALDLHHQMAIYRLLHQLNREQKLTIIVVTHDINLAAQFCSRIILLHQGRVLSDGVPDEVLKFGTIQDIFGVKVYIDINPFTKSIFVQPYALGDE